MRLKVETRGILCVSDNGAEPTGSSIFTACSGSFKESHYQRLDMLIDVSFTVYGNFRLLSFNKLFFRYEEKNQQKIKNFIIQIIQRKTLRDFKIFDRVCVS